MDLNVDVFTQQLASAAVAKLLFMHGVDSCELNCINTLSNASLMLCRKLWISAKKAAEASKSSLRQGLKVFSDCRWSY